MTSKPNKPVISVATAVIGAVAKWAGTDETRSHLQMVLFTKGTMVAVDGHRMVIVPCETFGLTIGVNRDCLLAAVAAQGVLESVNRHITIEPNPLNPSFVTIGISQHHGLHMIAKAADTTAFPNYNQVVKANSQSGTMSLEGYRLNPRYLADIVEVHAATAIGQEHVHGVRVVAWSDDHLGPMVFENGMGVKFLIMPMRPPE
jgi:hypothetical protein